MSLRAAWLPAALLLAAAAPAESLEAQVNRAIERGVAAVRKAQRPDGSFAGERDDHYPDGVTALALCALLKSEVPASDPAVAKALDWLRYRKVEKTYSAGVRILALDALNDPSRGEEIRGIAKWIEENVHGKDRLWSYPFGPTKEYSKTDLSNTQYAVLGLWVAGKHGYRAADRTWADLLLRVPALQAPEGGFFYSDNRGSRTCTGSMTTAGILALTVALDRIDAGDTANAPAIRRGRESLARAWAYLDRRFVPGSDVEGAYAFRHDWYYYYAYGIERIAAAAGRKRIGDRDWYREGARAVVRAQRKEGDWGALHDTCFALLFLRRATFTMLGAERPPVEGEGEDLAGPPEPARPGPGVPFVRRWLLLGPFPDPDDAALGKDLVREEAARPREGQAAAGRTWIAAATPDHWLDLRKAAGATDRTVSYGFTWLYAARDADVVLWFGHDDACRVLLDGALVHDFHFHEGHGRDFARVPARLAKGVHRVLFKVEERWGGSGFCLRIARPDGTAVPEVRPSLSPHGEDLAETALAHAGLFTPEELLRELRTDPDPAETFDGEASLLRVGVSGTDPAWPDWLAGPRKPGARGPAPGFSGALGIHPDGGGGFPARVWRKVRVPNGHPVLRVRAAGESGSSGGKADVLLRLGVFEKGLTWLREEVVGGTAGTGKDPWRTVEGDLEPWQGREVLLVVEVAYAGAAAWEEAWIDEMSAVNVRK